MRERQRTRDSARENVRKCGGRDVGFLGFLGFSGFAKTAIDARRGELRGLATPRVGRRWVRARGGGWGGGAKRPVAYLSPALYTSILMVMFLPITSWSSTTDCGRDSGGGQIAGRHADPRSGASRQARAGEVPATRYRSGASHREGRHRVTHLVHDEVRLGGRGVFLRDRAGRHERGDERDNREARENSRRGSHGFGDSARRLEGGCRVRRCATRRGGRIDAGTTRRTSVARRVSGSGLDRTKEKRRRRRAGKKSTPSSATCERASQTSPSPGMQGAGLVRRLLPIRQF